MLRGRSLLLLGLLAGCGEDATMTPSSSSTTPSTTTTTMTTPPQCGDDIPDDGEVCFQVERKAGGRIPGVLVAGDFNGDGQRDFYSDRGGLGGEYVILAEEPHAMTVIHEGRFAGKDNQDHAVYRASARDIDEDGFTDLLTLMQYNYLSGDTGGWAFGAIVLHTRPGYQFDEELKLFWEYDIGFQEPENRFDGAFGDFDGDGVPEVVFVPNLHRGYVWYVEPGAAPGELFRLDYHLDFGAFAAQDNIVTVVVDLDADGRDDLVLVDGLGRVWTHYSDPEGVLVPRTLTDTPVLPPLVGTVLARDVDGDGYIDLVGATTRRIMGQLSPGELGIARGDGNGGFTPMAAWTAPEGPTQTSSPYGPQLCYVHLVLLDLDASGYPALIYALPGSRTLVVHPQVGRTLGAEPLEISLDLAPFGIFADPQDDGTVDLLVSLWDDAKADDSDDYRPFIDRYRIDP